MKKILGVMYVFFLWSNLMSAEQYPVVGEDMFRPRYIYTHPNALCELGDGELDDEVEQEIAALLRASYEGDVETIDDKLQCGDNIDYASEYGNAVTLASMNNQVEALKHIFGVLQGEVAYYNLRGWHPIHYLARNGCKDGLDVLVLYDINYIDLKTSQGETPEVVAAKAGHNKLHDYIIKLKEQ